MFIFLKRNIYINFIMSLEIIIAIVIHKYIFLTRISFEKLWYFNTFETKFYKDRIMNFPTEIFLAKCQVICDL